MEGKNNLRRKKAGTECSDTTLSISLSSLPFAKNGIKVSCIYPKNEPVKFEVDGDVLTVCYDKPVMARLFEVTPLN